MYRLSINFHKRLEKGEVPISYILIETHMGYRIYAEKELKGVFSILPNLYDGTYFYGTPVIDIILYGAESAWVMEKSGRVISFGSFDRSLQSLTDDILASYQSKTLQHISIELDNSDRYFSRLIASEPFIGRPLRYYVGFETLSQSEHLELFSGMITEMTVMSILTIEANEE